MYTPSSFKETDPKVLLEFIQAHNFGTLFSQSHGVPEATHLPFMVNFEEHTLTTHMARANKHWRKLEDVQQVLCVFQGPHSYITPAWYKDRVTVPTWNYASVHVYGTPLLIHDSKELRSLVTELTEHHESMVDTDWSLEEGEPTMETDLKAIVGIQINITDLQGTFKFNQNRSKEDQQGVIDHLEKGGEKEVSCIMRRNLKGE